MRSPDRIRARTDLDAKERAAAALADMGVPISEAIRLLRLGVAGGRRLPVGAKALDAATPKAVAELEGWQAKAFERIADFIADLRNEGD